MNDYVQIPNSASLNIGGNAITISLWVNPQDGASDAVLIAKPWTDGSMADPYYQYAIEIDRNGGDQADFYFTDSAGVLHTLWCL
jgi:hypothetical protein